MRKRIKKPPVELEKRRNWLERSEAGESPPKIAERDEFDVRTVRKHIELAKLDREAKEARATVVRGALEDHYKDIVKFAEKLDAEIVAEAAVSQSLREDHMWTALKQHQPRSPLWNLLGQWDTLQQSFRELNRTIKGRLQKKVEADMRLKDLTGFQFEAAVSGTVAAIDFQMRQWASGAKGLDLGEDFGIKQEGNGTFEVRYGSFHMGSQDEQHANSIRDLIADWEKKVTSWKGYDDLLKISGELMATKKKLRDELATVILRRIVTGRCKYCPF